METGNLKTADHHQQQQLCENRPPYRQGRKLTAVKTYTISSESQHLFFYGVPKINLRTELKKLCSNYGDILKISPMENYETEIFTECFHVHYKRIQSARIAKRFLDNKSFYGGILHVCYAPEFETIEDTKHKLLQRTKDVLYRLNLHASINDSNKPVNDAAVYGFPLHVPKEIENHMIGPSFTNNVTEGNTHEIYNQIDISVPIVQTATYPETETANQEEVTIQFQNSEKQLANSRNISKNDSRHKQTPAYFWKNANTETISPFKERKKRSSTFIPSQITKKKFKKRKMACHI